MDLLVPAAVLGALLGSFINALSFRWGTGRSVLRGRSRCMHCGKTLGALELVPVLSYLFLRGRCLGCSSRISVQYPLVELVAAGLAALVYGAYPFSSIFAIEFLIFCFWLLVWMVLLFIVVYDLRHQIIPPQASALLFLLAALGALFELVGRTDLLAGLILAAPLFLLSAVSQGRLMGWADSGLELSLGWLLGLSMGLTGLMLAFWSGAIVGIVLMAAKKGITIKSEVPFAPFLVFGAGVAHFFHVDFFQTLPALFL